MSTQTAAPAPPALDPALVATFRTLAAEWHDATRFLSGGAEAHPAYRAIIALGPAVVPVILAQMAVDRDWYMTALEELTGENPVPSKHHGRLRLMTEDWLAWGRARGLV